MSAQYQDFTSTGGHNWTVPTAVKNIDSIKLVGGGGGGGTGTGVAGGGGGAFSEKDNISTSPGTVWSFTVGAGGVGGDGTDGSNTSWNSGEFIAGGGFAASGNTIGSGGTASGSGSPSLTSQGGDGGYGCSTSCNQCVTCNSYCCAYDSNMNCLSTCYSCYNGNTSGSSCDANGGGGTNGSDTNPYYYGGNSASCSNNSPDGCGYCTGTSCGGASIQYAPGFPNGYGGGAGQNGYLGGGGGGGSAAGGDGIVRISWTSGYLYISQQPTPTHSNVSISPAITVEVRFADNTLDTSYNGSVTVAISNNPASGTLSGTTTVNASSGIATFSDLSIDNVGNGYTLVFSCTDVDSATSSPFDITNDTFNETGTSGVLIGGAAIEVYTPFNSATKYEVYALNRPVVESVLVLSNLRPSRKIR